MAVLQTSAKCSHIPAVSGTCTIRRCSIITTICLRGRYVVAILGTTQLANLQTNLGALDCRLTEENRATLDELADQVLGDRYAPEGMSAINR